MIVQKINIPKIIADNDAAYLNHIEYLIRGIDNNANIKIVQRLDSLCFHVTPSLIDLKQSIIRTIRKSHYNLNLKIQFSKSVNATNIITFWTCFNE